MNLELQILTSLRRVEPYMLPVPTLWAEVKRMLVPQPSHAAFLQALRILEEEKRQIVRVTTADSDKAKITSAGIARHEEAQS